MPWPISSSVSVHNATGIDLAVRTTEDGTTKWLDLSVHSEGEVYVAFNLTIHAGHSPALWEALCDLADAWKDSQRKPTPEDEAAEDERLRAEGASAAGAPR